MCGVLLTPGHIEVFQTSLLSAPCTWGISHNCPSVSLTLHLTGWPASWVPVCSSLKLLWVLLLFFVVVVNVCVCVWWLLQHKLVVWGLPHYKVLQLQPRKEACCFTTFLCFSICLWVIDGSLCISCFFAVKANRILYRNVCIKANLCTHSHLSKHSVIVIVFSVHRPGFSLCTQCVAQILEF